MTRRPHDDDRGAVAFIVVILLTLVLLGLGAFVTDVGSWYAEKGQLQNGADSAALAVAQTCATQTACTTAAADSYANANANDGLATVDAVCGSGSGLSGCGSTSCPAGNGNYVDVSTETLTSNGSHLMPPLMANLLPNLNFAGEHLTACAQASWTPASSASGALAVTFSFCTWTAATANGTVFAPPPPYASWPPAVPGYTGKPPATGTPGGEQVLMLHGSGNDCAGNDASGWQLPGGFGWLQDTGSPHNCTTTVNTANTYNDNTGVSASDACVTALQNDYTDHTVVYLPIYDGLRGSGANGVYHLAGFGAFVITGGYVNGSQGGFKQPSNITGKDYCSGSDRCLYGFFTKGLIPNAGSGGPSLPGVTTVTLTG